MSRKVILYILTAILIMAACSKDGETDSNPAVAAPPAPYQVMVVFASGQLGDRGYADGIMNGISMIRGDNEFYESDIVDVQFIACYDDYDTCESMADWATDTENPFYNSQYERRLLVLTEPYMLNWLPEIIPLMQPHDEVLVMKVIEEDVKLAADTLGLGNRLHGLNIPATQSARKYCQYIKQVSQAMSYYSDQPFSTEFIPFYRLYSTEEVNYRDSIAEVMQEELGSESTISQVALSDGLGTGNYSMEMEVPLLQLAYGYGQEMSDMYAIDGTAFCIVDLGTANAGFDYVMVGQEDESFRMLVLDGQEIWNMPYRRYIKRGFGDAMAEWADEWIMTEPFTMPAMISLPHYCTDNIPEPLYDDDYDEDEMGY